MSFVNQAFIEQLLIKAMPDIDDEALDLMIEEVDPVLYDRVTTHLALKLNDDQKGEFARLIETDASYENIYKFLEEAIPGYEDFIAVVYDTFEEQFLKDFPKFEEEMKKRYEKDRDADK
jgi:hypothetical protein